MLSLAALREGTQWKKKAGEHCEAHDILKFHNRPYSLIHRLFRFSHAWPVIGSERGGRNTTLVLKIADRTVAPAVTHCDWLRHVLTPHHHGATFNSGVRPNKLAVTPRDCESSQHISPMCAQTVRVRKRSAYDCSLAATIQINWARWC